MQTTERLHAAQIDAVCAAAASAFGFVFIHPLEDGNGRIHRFLIHHMLARSGFAPDGLLFPVSAVMLRDRRGYDRVLNSYSDLYRYWDATAFAEYPYIAVEQAIQHDLPDLGHCRYAGPASLAPGAPYHSKQGKPRARAAGSFCRNQRPRI